MLRSGGHRWILERRDGRRWKAAVRSAGNSASPSHGKHHKVGDRLGPRCWPGWSGAPSPRPYRPSLCGRKGTVARYRAAVLVDRVLSCGGIILSEAAGSGLRFDEGAPFPVAPDAGWQTTFGPWVRPERGGLHLLLDGVER